jgi:transposase
MAYIKGIDRNQSTFLPPSLDEYIDEDSIVRVIDAFVDGLDLEEMDFGKARPASTGRPAYDPRALLKLYLYGYTNRIRSSRKLQAECARNVEVMYLLGGLKPDFRTIADFRKDNPEALKQVFAAFVSICTTLKLFDSGMLAVDGTKLRAQNSRANAYNAESLEKKLANINEHIARYLSSLDESDADEGDVSQPDKEAIQRALEELRGRKATYEGFQQILKQTDQTQILTTDPEAHRMHTKDGFNCSYNIQAAVNTDTHLIAGFDATSCPTDQGYLLSTASIAKDLIGKKIVEVVADKGYESARDIKDCLLNGVIPHVAFKYNRDARVFNLPYRPCEITKDLLSSTKPEDISVCLHAGQLPESYKNKGIVIEVQRRDTLSCFTKEDDGWVTCPMNKSLPLRKKNKDKGTEMYRSADVCRECLNRCTDSTSAKEVSFGPDTDTVPVMMYGSPTSPPRQIPLNAKISPNNHTLDRKDYADQKVVIIIPHDKDKLHKRMCTVEHPFGTIKWYDGAHYLLMRGKRKIEAEVALSFLGYNLRRAMSIVGTKKLIAACG